MYKLNFHSKSPDGAQFPRDNRMNFPKGMFSSIAHAQTLFIPIIAYILEKLYTNSIFLFEKGISGNRMPPRPFREIRRYIPLVLFCFWVCNYVIIHRLYMSRYNCCYYGHCLQTVMRRHVFMSDVSAFISSYCECEQKTLLLHWLIDCLIFIYDIYTCTWSLLSLTRALPVW